MSRAFLQDDAVQDAVLIPARAPLPAGVPNHVTPRGLELLQAERDTLEAERSTLRARKGSDPDKTRRLTELNGRIGLVEDRIRSARVVDPAAQPADEARFGARVAVRTVKGARAGLVRRFAIVGVDEADPSEGRIAFTAPIARAVIGLKISETACFRTPEGEETLELVEISY